TLGIDPGNGRAYRNIDTFLAGDVADHAAGRRVDFHRGLVGLYLEKHIALPDRCALLDEPAGDLAGRHVHVDLGQYHLDRHQRRPLTRSRAAATISGTCGTEAFSNSGL